MPEYQKFKRELENRLKALDARVKSINADITHSETPLSNDWSEQAVERENEEVLEALGNAYQEECRQIKLALKRIESGSYGTCLQCDEPIPEERLALIPHATLCARCAGANESKSL